MGGLEELCSQIDRQIVFDLKIYPTHSEAAFRLALSDKSFEGCFQYESTKRGAASHVG